MNWIASRGTRARCT